jgi:hypothetical protein
MKAAEIQFTTIECRGERHFIYAYNLDAPIEFGGNINLDSFKWYTYDIWKVKYDSYTIVSGRDVLIHEPTIRETYYWFLATYLCTTHKDAFYCNNKYALSERLKRIAFPRFVVAQFS